MTLPADGHAVCIDFQGSPYKPAVLIPWLAQGIEASEQGGNPGHQVRETDVLGQVIIGAEPQSGYRVKFAVAGGQKNDRQLFGLGPQDPAQFETAFDVITQIDINDDKVGQARLERDHRLVARRISVDEIPFALECGYVIVADCSFILDDSDALGQNSSPLHSPQCATLHRCNAMPAPAPWPIDSLSFLKRQREVRNALLR